MRRLGVLVLAAVTVATAFAGLLAVVPEEATPAARAASPEYGPHRMLANPDQTGSAPPEPLGWTGTPPGTRGSSLGTRVTGQQDVLVILLDFADEPSSRTSASINTQFNDATVGASSVRNYYDEVSYGLFGLSGTVTSWFRSSRTFQNYGQDSSSTSFDDANGPIYRMVIEAVQLANPTVNFQSFDGDGDGIVDHVIVVHAGDAQEENTAQTDLVWSHRWSVVDAEPGNPGNQRLTADGVQIYGYIMVAETSPVGVMVHELGHDLGLPDLYDTDGSSDGVGEWDVMGSGSWNGVPSGSRPAHYGAPSKIELGWINPILVDRPFLGQAIDDVETNPQAFKLPIRATSPEEYFIVENRQLSGFDASLPGDGLLIWHVDLAEPGNADDTHRRVDLEEADGDDRPTEAADPWSDSRDGFGPDTSPNSNSYLNQRTGWKVRNIGPSGAVMVADLSREVDDDLVLLGVGHPCCVPVGGSATVTVTVGNRGARTQTAIDVNLNAYAGSPDPASIVCCASQTVASLAQGETVNLTFSVSASAAGKYILEAFVPLALDEIPENNLQLAHFAAATYRFYDDVTPGDPGWARNGDPSSDPAIWEIVRDVVNETASHSPPDAWRFHTVSALPPICPPFCPPAFHTLTSAPVTVPAGPNYLYFWHRWDLRGRGIDNLTGNQETDVGYVNVTIDDGGGPVTRNMLTIMDLRSEWTAELLDLSQYTTTAATVVVSFSVSDNVLQDDGGWWVDDIAVADAPLLGGIVARAVTPQTVAEPGALAVFRIKVANVGDFDDDVGFALQPPSGWLAGIGPNLTRLQPYDTFEVSLHPDEEANLLLVFQVSADAVRGSRHTVPVTAASRTNTSFASTFDTLTVINDPFGLAGLERYVFLFLIVFAAVIIVAVVIDAMKKQRGVYRRW